MPSTGSRLYLDVLHKPPRSEISNLGLIQAWITRKALGDRHPIALELYGDGGASYGALLNVIQHVIKTELAQEVKPPRGNNGMVDDATSHLPRTPTLVPRPWQAQSRDDKVKAIAIIARGCPALHKCYGGWLGDLLFQMKITYVRGNVDRPPRAHASFTSTSTARSSPAFESLPDRHRIERQIEQVEQVDITDVNDEDTDVDTEVDMNENESPQNTDDEAMDEEEMDDEDGQANFGTPIQYQTVAVSHPSSFIPETPVSTPKTASKRKRPSQIETPSVSSKRTKRPTAKVVETAENLASAAKRRAEANEAAEALRRTREIADMHLVSLQGRTYVGLEGSKVIECAPHEELVVATGAKYRMARLIGGRARTCFVMFKRDIGERDIDE
ncbi:hypothetical protein EG327_005683 [Venturia inaequalis]|uniref:Uncharacterized protein n=1 Tax=Venturia inaequalis TaxID=5025 RepID=A0A8H3VMZ6_VENIN|nr:hypothetical protein EG327_005683 [Venturia inaequalis]